VETVRALEDLIIDCVYANLLQGKLDQRKKAFEVQWVMGRDLGPTEVSDMMQTVETWLAHTNQLMTALDEKMKAANTIHEKKKNDAAAVAKQKSEIVENIKVAIQAGDQDAIAMAMGMPPPGGDQKGGKRQGKGAGGDRSGAAGAGSGAIGTLLNLGGEAMRKFGRRP